MLTPTKFSDEFESFINRYNSYTIPDSDDPEFEPSKDQFALLRDEDGNIVPPEGDYPSAFASAYEAYSLDGIVLGADHGLQEPEIIENYLRSFISDTISFATALATYWSTMLIVPSIPSHGGVSVVSVTNDALDQIEHFHTAIIQSISTEYKYPVMAHLMTNIQTIALPEVTWFVTEMMPNGSPTIFPEKVV